LCDSEGARQLGWYCGVDGDDWRDVRLCASAMKHVLPLGYGASGVLSLTKILADLRYSANPSWQQRSSSGALTN
jgi:hypothetical protein